MKANKNENNGEKGKEEFTKHAFDKAQEVASEGKSQQGETGEVKKEPGEKAKDDLFRAKEADKEWSSESDEYRRDNA